MSEKETGSSTKITAPLIVGIGAVVFSCACVACSVFGYWLWTYGDALLEGVF